MGLELSCTAHFNDRSSSGKAMLEDTELRFRGDFRVTIPLKQIKQVESSAGVLTVVHRDGEIRFDLGKAAETWAQRIKNPKSLLEKLGLKKEHSITAVGNLNESFLSELRAASLNVATHPRAERVDMLFIAIDARDDLIRLEKLKSAIKDSGALWIIRPKGSSSITEKDVLEAGRNAGLVDIKVVRFSDTHTAEKFVFPKASRTPAQTPKNKIVPARAAPKAAPSKKKTPAGP